jgi:molecular chaperone DnaK
MDKLNTIFQAAAQDMYGQGGQAGDAGQGQAGNNGGDGEVTDVDFEEVKDDKK